MIDANPIQIDPKDSIFNLKVISFYIFSRKNITQNHTQLNLMPYVLRKQSRRGYKVCKKGTRKCFSKRALTKRMAVRQMRALYLNESVKRKQSSKQSSKQSGG